MRSVISAILLASSARLALGQMTHNVNVGANGALTYDPPTIEAAVGDTVLFTFLAKNHTATQSSFDSPCTKLIGADGVTPSGFDSGFQPLNSSGISPTSSFVVQATTPLWFYCRQKTPASHCAAGMVFAVNPPAEGNTFDKFKAAAQASGSGASASSAAPSATTTSSGMITSTVPATSSAAYSTPPAISPPATVTVTVTAGSNVYTTVYGSYPGSPAPTPNAEPTVHTITVGGPNGLVFSPSNITAQPKDIVQFKFLSKAHSATQSGFSNPCSPLAATADKTPFDSGILPATDDVPVFWNVTVNDTAPIWVYCKQVGHCGKGMVFSVNSLESGPNNFDAFRNLAIHLNGTSATNSSSSVSGSSTAPSASATTKPSSAMGRPEMMLGITGLSVMGAAFALLL